MEYIIQYKLEKGKNTNDGKTITSGIQNNRITLKRDRKKKFEYKCFNINRLTGISVLHDGHQLRQENMRMIEIQHIWTDSLDRFHEYPMNG